MGFLDKIIRVFRRDEVKGALPPPSTNTVEQLDVHRSKRTRIKDVLRRYEQGRISEAEAVEEIIKVTRPEADSSTAREQGRSARASQRTNGR